MPQAESGDSYRDRLFRVQDERHVKSLRFGDTNGSWAHIAVAVRERPAQVQLDGVRAHPPVIVI